MHGKGQQRARPGRAADRRLQIAREQRGAAFVIAFQNRDADLEARACPVFPVEEKNILELIPGTAGSADKFQFREPFPFVRVNKLKALFKGGGKWSGAFAPEEDRAVAVEPDGAFGQEGRHVSGNGNKFLSLFRDFHIAEHMRRAAVLAAAENSRMFQHLHPVKEMQQAEMLFAGRQGFLQRVTHGILFRRRKVRQIVVHAGGCVRTGKPKPPFRAHTQIQAVGGNLPQP